MRSTPLNVLFTVDTEVYPLCRSWRTDGLRGDMARDIYGATPKGNFGVKYQADILQRYGLKAVFFVEALFACAAGIEPLAEVVDILQSAGQEVQLHIHTEWLDHLSDPPVDAKEVENIKDLDLAMQTNVVECALANLRQAGAENVCAFRAGNYGANFDTLRALRKAGIRCDSSYNYPYLGRECGLQLADTPMLVQPREVEGVLEVPVNCFRDYPGHYRHTQLCAISAREMRHALAAAHAQDWHTFVIVSHSFELLRDRKRPVPWGKPDWIVINRFEALCRYLADNRDRYQLVGFCDLPMPRAVSTSRLDLEPVLTMARTAERVIGQAVRRLPL